MTAFTISSLQPSVEAVLWDMDGLLADTEPLWTVAENAVCASVGGVFTPQMKARIVGTRLDTAIPILVEELKAQGCVADGELLSDGLLDAMLGLFAGELSFMPGALQLLTAVAETGIPQALVSSSFRSLVDGVLQWLPESTFAYTLAGDEVTHAKPDPEPYLTAAERLGIATQRCLVLEDSPSGMRAALSAGCHALMVPSVYGVSIEPGWNTVASLLEVSV